jgi:serine protease inhibitor
LYLNKIIIRIIKKMSKFEFERLPLSNLTEETKKKSNKIKIAILAVVLVTACYFIFSKGSTPKVNGTASI